MLVDGEPADARHVGLRGGVVDGHRRELMPPDALAVRRAIVAGRRHDGLALGGHLFEDRLLDLRGRRRSRLRRCPTTSS